MENRYGLMSGIIALAKTSLVTGFKTDTRL